jgi:hypothetical protein
MAAARGEKRMPKVSISDVNKHLARSGVGRTMRIRYGQEEQHTTHGHA